jgi:hypothetical protein
VVRWGGLMPIYAGSWWLCGNVSVRVDAFPSYYSGLASPKPQALLIVLSLNLPCTRPHTWHCLMILYLIGINC